MFTFATKRLLSQRSSTASLGRRGMAYSKKIIDYFNNPKHIGSMNSKSPDVGTGLVGAPACGDVMKLQIRVKNNIIEDAKFKTFGCGSAIASSEYAAERIIGKTVEEAGKITNKEIATHLKLPPIKLHCSMLSEDAIKSAVKDYLTKT